MRNKLELQKILKEIVFFSKNTQKIKEERSQ
jgi:hypothetical protein